MLEHGLAVIIARPDQPYGALDKNLNPRVYSLTDLLKTPEKLNLQKEAVKMNLPEITEAFIDLLEL